MVSRSLLVTYVGLRLTPLDSATRIRELAESERNEESSLLQFPTLS